MAETNGQLRQEEAVLHVQDFMQILKARWKYAFLVFFLIFLSCALITKMMTPRYTSAMLFEIKRPVDLINLAVGGDVSPIQVEAQSSVYIPTHFQMLLSEQCLSVVANKLDLPNELGVDEKTVVAMLQGCIKLEPVVGTNLINVFVTYKDPRMAQRICEALPLSYKELREEKENALVNEAVNKRYEVLRSRQDELERKADVVRQYIRSGKYVQGMWSLDGRMTPSSTAAEEQTYRLLHDSRLRLEEEISQMLVHVSKLQTLKDKDLLSYVTRTGLLSAESYSSARVRELNETYRNEEETRSQMLISGYGEAHPKLKSLAEVHHSTETQLYAELMGMRDAMQDQLDVKKAEMVELVARCDEARNKLREKTLEDQKVMLALQEYNAEKMRYDKLENDYIVDRMRLMTPRQTIEIFSEASLSMAPSTPNYKVNLLIGAVLGIIVGIGAAFLINYFDTSIKTLEEAERALGLPVLGVIPQDAGLLALSGGNSPDAEAYRILRTNVELKKMLYKAHTFAIVSANAGEGKSTTLSNLAYVFATAGNSVLMVDADLRRPRLQRYYGIESDVGLSNYLTSDVELKDVVVKTDTPNLYLLPSGPLPTDPSGILGSHRMNQLLAEVNKRFDIVLFDAPPILGVSDSSLLVSKVDATLLVLQPRKMPLKALQRTKEIVQNVGGQIMGLVMNNVDISTDTQYQYYTTYYSYYTNDVARDNKKSAPIVDNKSVDESPSKNIVANTKLQESDDDIY